MPNVKAQATEPNAPLQKLPPLPREFFARDTHLVANELLGKLLVRRWRNKLLAGRITEVESYIGQDDLACHASRGRTPRTEVMFGPAGFAYVYLVYGLHELFNLVTEQEGFPAAVLIRSLEPIYGLQEMTRARGEARLADLTTGPAKLTQALRITRQLNRHDCCSGELLYVADDGIRIRGRDIAARPRIGVDYAAHCAAWPWRRYLKNSAYLSRKHVEHKCK